jgi:hypothetical protein
MPRAKGRASQTLIDRIHAKTARAIDATFNQHTKEKTFLAQAIKFLQTTDSTAPERVPQRVPVKTQAQLTQDALERRAEQAEVEAIELWGRHGIDPTPAEIAAFKAKYPDYVLGVGIPADLVDPSTDFRPQRELPDDQ